MKSIHILAFSLLVALSVSAPDASATSYPAIVPSAPAAKTRARSKGKSHRLTDRTRSSAAGARTPGARSSRSRATVGTSVPYSGPGEPGLTGNGKFSRMQVRFGLAYGFMSNDDLNKLNKGRVSGKDSIQVGNSFGWALAADYPIVEEKIFAGLRLEHFNASSDDTTIPGAKGTITASVSGTPFLLTGTYLHTVRPRFQIGGMVGAGLCLGYGTSLDVDGSDSTTLPNGTLRYGATPVMAQVSAIGAYEFASNWSVRMEVGYRLLSAGDLNARDNYAGQVHEGDLLKDSQDHNVGIGSSGLLIGLAINARL